MVNGAQLLEALASIENEKGIDREIALEGIKEGFQKAFERFYDTDAIIRVEIDDNSGDIKLLQQLKVVKTINDIEDDWLEIELEAALQINKTAIVGENVYKEIKFGDEFSRMAVGQVRQIFQQKLKATERESIYRRFAGLENEIVTGKIVGTNDNQTSYLLDIEGVQTSLWNKKCINGETFKIDQFVDVLIEEVSRENKYSQLSVSRIAPNFLIKLLEREISEVHDGVVEIVSASREAGKRAKISVLSHDMNVEPIGAIVGVKGARINQISAQLNGEKIDVIRYSEDFTEYLINAMAPVKVISVNEVFGEYDIVVPNEQLSLAIGKFGMAAKLVANLLKRRINIYSLESAKEANVSVLWNGNITEEQVNDPAFLSEVNKRKNRTDATSRENFSPRNNYVAKKPQYNIDREALSAFQDEIGEEYNSGVEEIDEELLAAINAVDSPAIDLKEIQAELASFNNVIEEKVVEEIDEDEEDLYEEYYD
ncbi:transcription termination factor NusA [Mesoplasma corruscae]|uniref:Transcription termination/antitermination protein NusA n=1 Tax=Mesoplasma corruscae TaxID=216874 RepID=A0A2S5RGF0_9MOLU|nr:transcription termination factor NusA [Mesoplasma corruscae]PPE06383.1 transcription elongation factor NusA [Mesoplasma corruscae]